MANVRYWVVEVDCQNGNWIAANEYIYTNKRAAFRALKNTRWHGDSAKFWRVREYKRVED